MPNTREKLIELLCDVIETDGCSGHCNFPPCYLVKACADHLIANGVTVQEWIPVTERLPEKDGRYLALKNLYGTIWYDVIDFAKDGRKVDKYDFEREWKNVWYQYSSEWGYVTTDNVTHWMPLPEPPKGE